mgnify:CR=1 FL=1
MTTILAAVITALLTMCTLSLVRAIMLAGSKLEQRGSSPTLSEATRSPSNSTASRLRGAKAPAAGSQSGKGKTVATKPVTPSDTPLLGCSPWCYYLGMRVNSWEDAASKLADLQTRPTRRTILAHARALERELGCPPPVGSPFRRANAGRPKGSRNRPKVNVLPPEPPQPPSGDDVPPEAA